MDQPTEDKNLLDEVLGEPDLGSGADRGPAGRGERR
jgi:hypothetical protein